MRHRDPRAPAVWLGLLAASLFSPDSARAQGEAEGLSASFRKAARRVSPAVVTVRKADATPAGSILLPLPIGGAEFRRDPGGSGVVIDAARGFVLTNDHVVAGPGRPVVTLPDGRERAATSIRRDPRSDLALLTIPAGGLTAAEWGDSDATETGDWVLAVGQPFGLSGTVTAGIVSGKGRGLGTSLYEDLVQTDAAINPGNSGGPLVDLRGRIVGINLAIRSIGGGYEGVGFAVPASRARRVAADLAEFGRVRRAQLGIRVGRPDPESPAGPGGVPVVALGALSPAAEAGLRVGDVILKLGDRAVTGPGMLQSTIEMAPIGEPVTLTTLRDGRRSEVAVRPVAQAEGPESPEVLPPPVVAPGPAGAGVAPQPGAPPPRETLEARQPGRFPELGLRLAESPADSDARGLVIRGVEPDGPADRGGFEIGMVITDVAGQRVATLADFRAALARKPADRDLILRVLKGKKVEFRVILDEARARGAEKADEVPEPLPDPDRPRR